jgi:starch synthase
MTPRILHVAAEIQPLVKTGGLADVLGRLPAAQQELGHEVAVLVPGYPAVRNSVASLDELITLDGADDGPVRVLRGRFPGTEVHLLVLDAPQHFDRPGNPYVDKGGRDWPDNHRRFALLGRAAAEVVRHAWPADVLHAHDWHAGLAPAYLRAAGSTCASCFTIHNLAYQGIFDHRLYPDTGLPDEFYTLEGLEFHGRWSFMKSALSFSDAITTVSPTYAREILTTEHGMGLEGVLRHRAAWLHGILNGVDYTVWDPATDPALAAPYSPETLGRKRDNKRALQAAVGVAQADAVMLVGVVSRLTQQKGLDLALRALTDLLASRRLQLVLLGSGDPALESAFAALADRYPERCAVHLGYDEALAHRIIGGADVILVPSRFEPCGLTQLYGLRYGTLPVVRHTGGLADTVNRYTTTRASAATGFVFDTPSATAARRALGRALKVYADPTAWQQLVRNAMRCDFGWDKAAVEYSELYTNLAARRSAA